MTRYYPGFLAALFLILLRIAIGWHFLYRRAREVRVDRARQGRVLGRDLPAERQRSPGALFPRAAARRQRPRGPRPDDLKDSWRGDVDRIADHFGFNDTQRGEASKLLDEAERWADHWFSDPENQEKSKKYLHDLDEVEATEKNPQALSYKRERAWEARRTLDADRRALVGPIHERGKALRDAVAKKATSEQVQAARAPLLSRVGPQAASASDSDAIKIKAAESARPWTQLDWINFATTYGLIAIGMCLILGFLTPLAALGAAAFLAMIYLSMPPWPGLPANPRAEGHYFIVSKNLIELIACLVIATTPTGHWVGLDALFFGAWRGAGSPRPPRIGPRLQRRDETRHPNGPRPRRANPIANPSPSASH